VLWQARPPGLRHRAHAADDGLVRLRSRSLPLPAGLRALVHRRLALVLGSVATLSAALLFAATPAGAVVKTVESTTVGLQPRSTALSVGVGTEPEHFANLSGNPV